MTNYEFLEQVVNYVKRTHNIDLHISPFGKNKIMLELKYNKQASCGGSIDSNLEFEGFKERVYYLCNWILKNKRK